MMSCPPTAIAPSEGVTIPQMMLIKVVLPAPLGPRRAKISPRRISSSMRLRALKPDAYVLDRFWMDTAGCMVLAIADAKRSRQQHRRCKPHRRSARFALLHWLSLRSCLGRSHTRGRDVLECTQLRTRDGPHATTRAPGAPRRRYSSLAA